MTSSNLQDCRILLLREATDNQDLIEQIELQQGSTMQWTALEIVNHPDLNPTETEGLLNEADCCIFISKNAAKRVLPWIETIKQKQLIAIGKGTEQCLLELGIKAVICPAKANTEALLDLPQLQQLKNKNLLVLKGSLGREKLQTELVKRGANVSHVDLYQRLSAKMTLNQAKQIITFDPNWIQLTSEASAVSLDKANQRFKLFNNQQIKVLTVSNRLKEKITRMGYSKVFNANSIYNDDNLKVLQNVQGQR